MRIIVSIIFLFLLLSGCRCGGANKRDWVIELPETKKPTDLYQWAVIRFQYSRLREEPKEDSKIINYLPEGVLINIIKKDPALTTFDNNNGYWFYIDYEGEKGWIFETYIEIFNSYNEAFKRSEEIILSRKKE